MASWESIWQEARSLNQDDAYDVVRRRKLDAVHRITGRHLVIYASDFTTQNPIKAQLTGNLAAISLTDKDGFDEVTRNLPRGGELDVLLHSPGGSAEATESIVDLLRARFSHVRFIIPNVAKSAATMMAMAGEELLMDESSELGPTDPQMIFVRNGQAVVSPAQAIKDEFEKAQKEVGADPSKLPSWLPILTQLGPSLLAECDNQLDLSRRLVSKWLAAYMFAGNSAGSQLANHVADYLANHNNFLSHSRRIGLSELKAHSLNILDLRTNPQLQEAIRDLYIALMLTFMNTGAYKIFENSKHEAMIAVFNMTVQAVPSQPQVPLQPQIPVPPAAQPIRQRGMSPLGNRTRKQVQSRAAGKKR